MSTKALRRCAAGALRRTAAVALVVLAGAPLYATPASAAATTGYVRLAHLSPDTPEVDVYLSSVSGAVKEQRFPGVGYGVVSQYLRLPTGAYAVSMRLAGAAPSTPPVLTTQVTVGDNRAYTVAGVGRHADLGLRVIDDDLALPPSGKAKVRIVQASVRASTLDVAISGGATIASNVAFASTTDYHVVDPGRWTLQVQPTGGGAANTVAARLVSGNVYSLIVLDGKNGGLTAELRTDAQRQGGIPLGGVDTGAGGSRGPDRTPLLVGVLALAMTAAALVTVRIRRSRRA